MIVNIPEEFVGTETEVAMKRIIEAWKSISHKGLVIYGDIDILDFTFEEFS